LFFLVFLVFSWLVFVFLVFLCFSWFFWVSLGFSWFFLVFLGFSLVFWVFLGFSLVFMLPTDELTTRLLLHELLWAAKKKVCLEDFLFHLLIYSAFIYSGPSLSKIMHQKAKETS
jgi:hypothetical protein